jgi:hypothetical protein
VRRLDVPSRARSLDPWATLSSTDGERAARTQLDGLLERAVTPRHGHLPPSADAVLFADESELLACLVGDVLSGAVARRWWWQLILARSSGAPSLPDLLTAHVRAIPGAFDLLVRWRSAPRALERLPARAAGDVLRSLAAAFELPLHGSRLHRTGHPRTSRATAGDDAATPRAPRPVVGAASGPSEPPPWERWIGKDAVPRDLGEPARTLLATGLLLHRHPAAARRGAHLVAVREAVRRADRGRPDGPRTAEEPRPTPTAGGPGRAPREGVAPAPGAPDGSGEAGPVASPSAYHDGETASAAAEPPRGSSHVAAGGTTGAPDSAAVPPPDVPTGEVSQGAPSAGTDPVHGTAGEGAGPSHQSRAGDGRSNAVGEGLVTGLAGIFFLATVMRSLRLPELFRTGWRLPDVGCWAVLDGLARALLDDHAVDVEDDPVWDLLAGLGGYPEADGPPSEFQHTAYALPREWWASIGAAGAAHWSSRGGIIRTWSEAGFVLTEGPCGAGAPRGKLPGLLRPYLPPPHRATRLPFESAPVQPVGRLTASAAPAMRRWLTLAAPFVRQRLAVALGVPATRAAAGLLLRPGVVHATRTHVDVGMRLEDVSLPVRLAGLDLDPGWVPCLGRVLSFSYE